MAFIEKLSPTIFHFIFLCGRTGHMSYTDNIFKKHSPSGFHASIHLLKLADERSTAVVAEVFEIQI